MMTYDALSFLLKAVIRFGLYMLLCISIYMLSASLRKKVTGIDRTDISVRPDQRKYVCAVRCPESEIWIGS